MAIYRIQLILLLLCASLNAETIWVAQTAAGSDTGADASNAHSAAWFNTAGNWGVDAGDISPGDTVMLTGTITSALTVQASGSSGNVTTIQYDTGAKSSAAYWGTGAAISLAGKSYITISGGTIECTANGTAEANQQQSYGITITGTSSNITVTNVSILNCYVRTANSSDSNEYGRGVSASGTLSDIAVVDCTITEAKYGVILAFNGGATSSNFTISGNTITNISTGVVVGSGGTSGVMNGDTIISGNTIAYGEAWDGTWSGGTVWHHNDGVHIWALSSSTMVGLDVSGNTIRDLGTHATGWIFLEGNITDTLIYNNVMTASGTSFPSNGFIALKQNSGTTQTGCLIANNSMYGFGGSGSGNGIYIDSTTGVTNKNNLVGNVYAAIYANSTAFDESDNNLLTGTYTAYAPASGFKNPLSVWQSYSSMDASSTEGTLGLTSPPSDMTLTVSSDAVDAGADLSAYFTTDITGATRSGTWDIGAYEYTGTDTTPPSFSSASISTGGTSITVTLNEATTIGSGGNGGVTISVDGGGAQSCTYSSGSGSTSLVYTCPQVYSGSTVTVSYTQPGDGWEDSAGNDVVTFSDQAVTNNSTATVPAASSSGGTITIQTLTIGL